MKVDVFFDRYAPGYRSLDDTDAQRFAALGRTAIIEQGQELFSKLSDAEKLEAFTTLLNAYENQKAEYSALAGSVNSLVWQVKELRVKLRQQGIAKLSREIDTHLLNEITTAVKDYD